MEHTALSAAAPVVLNSLDINTLSGETFFTFGRKLTTELFRKSYDRTLGRLRYAPDLHAMDIWVRYKSSIRLDLDYVVSAL